MSKEQSKVLGSGDKPTVNRKILQLFRRQSAINQRGLRFRNKDHFQDRDDSVMKMWLEIVGPLQRLTLERVLRLREDGRLNLGSICQHFRPASP